MRRFYLYIGILLIVILFGLLIYFRDGHQPYRKGEADFAVEKIDRADRICFKEGNRELSFKKEGNTWFLEEEGKEADPLSMQALLHLLENITIKSPVSDDYYKACCGDSLPVLVKIYSGRLLMNSYRVYQTRANDYGNVMQRGKNSQPFINYLPGYKPADISGFFSLSREDWLPRILLGYHPAEIQAVSVEYPHHPGQGFSISRTDHRKYRLEAQHQPGTTDTLAMERYLSYFRYVPFEQYGVQGIEGSDLLHPDSLPYCRIRLISTADTSELTAYTLYRRDQEGNLRKNLNRLAVFRTGSRRPLTVTYYALDPLLKTAAYFR